VTREQWQLVPTKKWHLVSFFSTHSFINLLITYPIILHHTPHLQNTFQSHHAHKKLTKKFKHLPTQSFQHFLLHYTTTKLLTALLQPLSTHTHFQHFVLTTTPSPPHFLSLHSQHFVLTTRPSPPHLLSLLSYSI
jgi:hypothetical protein